MRKSETSILTVGANMSWGWAEKLLFVFGAMYLDKNDKTGRVCSSLRRRHPATWIALISLTVGAYVYYLLGQKVLGEDHLLNTYRYAHDTWTFYWANTI